MEESGKAPSKAPTAPGSNSVASNPAICSAEEIAGATKSIPDTSPEDLDIDGASKVVRVEVPANGNKIVDDAGSMSQTGSPIMVPKAGEILPLPPTAPTNGNPSSTVRHKHKKSVSFVMENKKIASVITDASDADDGENKVVPPLPPIAVISADGKNVDKCHAEGINEDKCHAEGINEAFLRRNFGPAGVQSEVSCFKTKSCFFLKQKQLRKMPASALFLFRSTANCF